MLKCLNRLLLRASPPEDSLGSLLGRIRSELQDGTVDKAQISSAAKGAVHTVPSSVPIVQVGCIELQ